MASAAFRASSTAKMEAAGHLVRHRLGWLEVCGAPD